MDALAVFLVGIVLRFGIPIGVTALIIYALRRMDIHWQREAERNHALVAAAHPSGLRCWELRNCPPERRAACAAYARSDIPCWQVFRDESGRLREACLTCEVFGETPAPIAA